MKTIGVLGIQGAIEEHCDMIEKLGHKVVKVKTEEEINAIDAIILPGGESTAMGKQLDWFNLLEPLREKIKNGMPTFGTCAGMILLAKDIEGSEQIRLGLMNICVKRNAYGAQINSFITDINVDGIEGLVPAVFIRAPRIENLGKDVEVLASYKTCPILVREKNMLAASFHPELTDNLLIHKLFIEMVQ